MPSFYTQMGPEQKVSSRISCFEKPAILAGFDPLP
jgi:hypothetical protein